MAYQRIIIAAASLVFAAVPAIAAPRTVTVLANPDVVSREVTFADLDLTKADGQRALSRRISGAALEVCGPARFAPLLTTGEHLSCLAGALDEAKPQAALAIRRASELAANGWSAIPAVSLSVSSSL